MILREKYYYHAHIVHKKKETLCKEQQALRPIFFYPHQRAINLEGMHLNLQKNYTKNNYENDKRSMFSSNFEMFNVAMMKLEILNNCVACKKLLFFHLRSCLQDYKHQENIFNVSLEK
jgi:hypothetical protein